MKLARRGISQSPAKPGVVVTTTVLTRSVRVALARGPVDARERLGDGRVKRPALLGQRQGAVHAPEQRHAEPLLERLDLPAHRRLGQRDLVAGTGEAQVRAAASKATSSSSGGSSKTRRLRTALVACSARMQAFEMTV